MSTAPRISRPPKRSVLDVPVSVTSYDDVVARCIDAAQKRQRGMVDFMCVHGLITAQHDPKFKAVLNDFDIVAPDGQPVRWSLNKLHKANLTDRVYGPATMWKLCAAAEKSGVSIYLFGAAPETVTTLVKKLNEAFPKLVVAGAESPPFRALTPEEDAAAVERINGSGAGLLFHGISCPKQEFFAHAHRESIVPVQLCVGAAFDMHAGKTKMAPPWMQKRGLEWLWRLTQEPKRLWKRYLVYNTQFVALLGRELMRRRPAPVPIESDVRPASVNK